jgi:hypothetical protein
MGRIEIDPLKTTYAPGEQVMLTAYSAASGYVFSHWEGGDTNLLTTVTVAVMTDDRTLQAVFEPATDVSTLEQFQGVGGGGNFRLTQDIDAWATTNWNGGAGFMPIDGFSGILDGNGHAVRGLTITAATSGAWNGLFRQVSGSVIRRFGLEGGSVEGYGSEATGGLTGLMDGGTIEECFTTCDVHGDAWVGGLVGLANKSLIIRCYAKGGVTADGPFAGGLIGEMRSGLVRQCYAMGDVVSLCGCVGGLIGMSRPYDDTVRPYVHQCFATGSATCYGMYEYAGGLVGKLEGVAEQCFATGAASGGEKAGALLGSFTYDTDEGWRFGECYAIGKVTVYYASYGGILGGGLDADGWNGDSSYWDRETTGRPYGKSTVEMKQQATYAGWDFDEVWGIAEGVSYPYLRQVGNPLTLNVRTRGPGAVRLVPQKAYYEPGERVVICAEPDTETNMLSKWSGVVSDHDATVMAVTMDAHRTVSADFDRAIEISSIEQLQLIGHDAAYPLSGSYRLTQDIDATGTATWNGGAGFAPIGETTLPGFTGVFDGRGHVIRGLAINRPAETYVGLFGRIDFGGTVRNVGLAECSVVGNGSVAGLVGHSEFGRVGHAFVSGAITGGEGVGAVVGYNGGVTEACYALGQVAGGSYVGGLAGGPNAIWYNDWESKVIRCYSAAAVSGNWSVGGLAAYGTVTQSYWDVEASGCASSAGGEGRTTAEMMQRATYAGWNFSTEWGIDEGAGYPFLWRFRLGLPPGLGVSDGANGPAYAAWAASHTNAWGTTDFSDVPQSDFEKAWLVDERPAEGVGADIGFEVAAFEVGDAELRVTLALTAAGAAKQGSVNGWLAVEGKAELSDAWAVVATQGVGEGRIVFADGLATVVFDRPEGYRFFRPVLRPTRPDASAILQQTAP